MDYVKIYTTYKVLPCEDKFALWRFVDFSDPYNPSDETMLHTGTEVECYMYKWLFEDKEK